MKVKTLAARMNGLGNFLRICRTENKNDVTWRLLERFQKRIKRRSREHMNLVDNVNLVATARRRIINAPDDLFTYIINTGA